MSDVSVDCGGGGTIIATEVVVDDLALEGARQLDSLISLALFGLGLTSSESLFSDFARHAACARARPDGETLLASQTSRIQPATSKVPAWTTRLRIDLLPLTPMLATHWKAREKR